MVKIPIGLNYFYPYPQWNSSGEIPFSINPKFEFLNSKQILNSINNFPNLFFWNLGFSAWNLFSISYLGFRIFIFLFVIFNFNLHTPIKLT